jgi:hypothetical protein
MTHFRTAREALQRDRPAAARGRFSKPVMHDEGGPVAGFACMFRVALIVVAVEAFVDLVLAFTADPSGR